MERANREQFVALKVVESIFIERGVDKANKLRDSRSKLRYAKKIICVIMKD